MAFRLNFGQFVRDDAGRQPAPVISSELLAAQAAQPAEVPHGIQLAAGWIWRLLVIGAGLFAFWRILGHLSEVVIPLMVALLLCAALWPVKSFLQRRGLPRWLAVTLSLLLLVGLVVGIFALVGTQIAEQSSSLADAAVQSYQQFMNWLGNGPLHLQQAQIESYTDKVVEWAKGQQSAAADYAAAAGTQASHFFAGTALALFALFYFLFEGRSMARTGFQLVPRGQRARIEDACLRGWTALVSYVRAAVIVAAVDGAGAGLGALLVGSNLWLAIGALTFICAFVPLLGAFVSGLVATSVVLLTLGFWKAIIMLVVFVAVMEIEAHGLQPFLLGKAVSIHPLAVLYGIAIGTIVGGILGALFAVPLMAFGNAFIRALASHGRSEQDPDKPPATDQLPDEGEVREERAETKIDDLPPGPEAMAAVMEASAREGSLPDQIQPGSKG
ncbi:AI-2E family transporter [Luteococcus peritonei]|uniref:AI-2E family transporter n=1 Tax=Luteococcus peritonei TaxID=88874 RepID=A0ABW4RYV2_9ACTN